MRILVLVLVIVLVQDTRNQSNTEQLVRNLASLVSQVERQGQLVERQGGVERFGQQVLGSSPQEECDTAGFERRQREECQEVTELECAPVNITKYRTEIVNKCTSLVDQECHVVQVNKPKKECKPGKKIACSIEYRIEEEEVFEEQCNTNVKNICEEPYPTPVPIEVPYQNPAPDYRSLPLGTPPFYPPPYHGRYRRYRRHIPAPPGCRSVVSQECHQVPKLVSNKAPYEKCQHVPTLDCDYVLKQVPEEQCMPTVKQECKDKVKRTPYLVEEEECDEVVYDECYQIEEQVRVVVCTRTKLDETAIFLQRGPIKRREGEKNRKTTGRRRPLAKQQRDEETDKNNSNGVKIKLEDLTAKFEEFLTRDLSG